MVLTSTEIERVRRELSTMGLEIRPVKRFGPKRQLIVRIDEKLYYDFENYLREVYGSFYGGIKGLAIEEAIQKYIEYEE
ncbi:hypothetical protein ES703_09726 [subsurface metagenome]